LWKEWKLKFACLYVAKIHRVKSGVRFKWWRREKKRVNKKKKTYKINSSLKEEEIILFKIK
jgi:hypothetical protein